MNLTDCRYDAVSRTIVRPATDLGAGPAAQPGAKPGPVLVCCAGTSDIPVAEEAAVCAEALGLAAERLYDVGVAGIHRLLDARNRLEAARVLIVVAGMEGALPSVVGGLTAAPVIAVPTSIGYGASFDGLAALLAMLNSCASGIAVMNIDNGFGAAALAAQNPPANLLADPGQRPSRGRGVLESTVALLGRPASRAPPTSHASRHPPGARVLPRPRGAGELRADASRRRPRRRARTLRGAIRRRGRPRRDVGRRVAARPPPRLPAAGAVGLRRDARRPVRPGRSARAPAAARPGRRPRFDRPGPDRHPQGAAPVPPPPGHAGRRPGVVRHRDAGGAQGHRRRRRGRRRRQPRAAGHPRPAAPPARQAADDPRGLPARPRHRQVPAGAGGHRPPGPLRGGREVGAPPRHPRPDPRQLGVRRQPVPGAAGDRRDQQRADRAERGREGRGLPDPHGADQRLPAAGAELRDHHRRRDDAGRDPGQGAARRGVPGQRAGRCRSTGASS